MIARAIFIVFASDTLGRRKSLIQTGKVGLSAVFMY